MTTKSAKFLEMASEVLALIPEFPERATELRETARRIEDASFMVEGGPRGEAAASPLRPRRPRVAAGRLTRALG